MYAWFVNVNKTLYILGDLRTNLGISRHCKGVFFLLMFTKWVIKSIIYIIWYTALYYREIMYLEGKRSCMYIIGTWPYVTTNNIEM